jgi:GNAT superfamily N-acetyltransferase
VSDPDAQRARPSRDHAGADEPTGYFEPARSYASLWFFVALLGVGFVIDLFLGGGIAHLIGWLIALVLVVGLNFVVVYAVRSEKSLRLTADELRVGDDVIGRGEIVAVAGGLDDDELPVLGWPTGKPRSLKGLTVRLFDGQDVVVPTRFPDRLEAALGLSAVSGPAAHQGVRAAARTDLPELADVDERADAVFRTAGYQLPDIPFSETALRRAKAVFVAGRPPIGFVQLDEVDGVAYVAEVAVIPKWMRQGIGTALLERACEWARRHGYPAITLITYADVPWNGPYYARRGFVETSDVTPGLAALRARETELGLDGVGRRIVMRREL